MSKKAKLILIVSIVITVLISVVVYLYYKKKKENGGKPTKLIDIFKNSAKVPESPKAPVDTGTKPPNNATNEIRGQRMAIVN